MDETEDVSKAFEDLEEEVSERASAIKCSIEDYQDGLRGLIGRLQVDLQASEESSRSSAKRSAQR